MKPKPTVYVVVCVAGLLFDAGCSRHTEHQEPAPGAAAPSASVVRHPLRGVVISVDAANHTALVKHEDIPGFMPAMTMQFSVDATVAKSLAPDQAITATLVQTDAGFRLEDVKPSAP